MTIPIPKSLIHLGRPRKAKRWMADLLEVDRKRVRLWMFGRAVADPRSEWKDDALLDFARKIAP